MELDKQRTEELNYETVRRVVRGPGNDTRRLRPKIHSMTIASELSEWNEILLSGLSSTLRLFVTYDATMLSLWAGCNKQSFG